jgi:hypothetical protein
MVKFVIEAALFAAIFLAVAAIVYWVTKPDKKESGVASLDDLGEEVDQSVKQFGETKQKVADAEAKVREMREKTDK